MFVHTCFYPRATLASSGFNGTVDWNHRHIKLKIKCTSTEIGNTLTACLMLLMPKSDYDHLKSSDSSAVYHLLSILDNNVQALLVAQFYHFLCPSCLVVITGIFLFFKNYKYLVIRRKGFRSWVGVNRLYC